MKRRDLEAHLAIYGCLLYRQGGAHSVFVDSSRTKTTAVPRHGEIKKGTVRQICKALGIPEP
jgi:mRNA interferase HicA